MARTKKKTITPEEEIQNTIATIVVDSEYKTAVSIQNGRAIDFESLCDMLECRRNEKDYEWMSDSYIPEMNSIILTDSSGWANQYFQSRDFVEVRLDGEGELDKLKAKAAKKCINNTLNDRDIYYFPKYIRARTINSLHGETYMLCWWEKEKRTEKITVVDKKAVKDANGMFMIDPQGNPVFEQKEREVEIEKVSVDRFNCDVIDPRNVFTDNKYCYTAQQKDWITVRSESTYDDQKSKEKINNYFNLDKVKEAIRNRNKETTETAKNTYAKESDGEINKTPKTYFDVIDRYGKFWAMVSERDEKGNPTKATPGIDVDGLPKDGAELIEMIITYDLIGNHKIMVRFEPTPFIDAQGHPYKPIVRGWCYIHPTKDEGLSDGRFMKELQVAINDTFNMGNDRVKLATLPTFIGRKQALDDNSTIYMEPEHVMEVEDINTDLKELRISDNISGALETLQLLMGKMQQVTSTYPTTMGALPDKSSTTATAVAGAETRTNARQNYKSLTFEYTFLLELYWIILQMYYRFAEDSTIIKVMGEDARYFDANADYTYTPVSSSIELEYNKHRKIQLYDQSIGRLSGLVKVLPELVPIIARMTGRQMELLGDEYNEIGDLIVKLAKAKPRDEKTGEQISDGGGPVQANQSGGEMSNMERMTREGSMAGMIR